MGLGSPFKVVWRVTFRWYRLQASSSDSGDLWYIVRICQGRKGVKRPFPPTPFLLTPVLGYPGSVPVDNSQQSLRVPKFLGAVTRTLFRV